MPETEVDEPVEVLFARAKRLSSMMPGDRFRLTLSQNGYLGAKNLVALIEDGELGMPNGEFIDLKSAADMRRWSNGGKNRGFVIRVASRFQKAHFEKCVRPFLSGALQRLS